MQVSAPGKLILTGEYAVLDGAPGLAMAINRRARVRLEPSQDKAWHLVSLQDQRSTCSFTFDEQGLPRWDQPASKSAFNYGKLCRIFKFYPKRFWKLISSYILSNCRSFKSFPKTLKCFCL